MGCCSSAMLWWRRGKLGAGRDGSSAAAAMARLPSKDLPGIASYMKSGTCKSVVMLTGAGVSTGAGIPDFRSPGGMYSTLRPELLTATKEQRARMRHNPTEVVMKDMFFENQFPYMEVRRPFILGTQQKQWKATLSHWFAKFLDEENMLTRVFTQNIDGLDYHTGISPNRVCNVHGSVAQVHCEGCGNPMGFDSFCGEVQSKIKDIFGIDDKAPAESTNIICPQCSRPLLKPSTVLFGGSLPEDFFTFARSDLPKADLLIVAGTSLVVSPANGVVQMVPRDCPRLIVNKEPVGMDLGIEYGPGADRDVFAGGRSCDEVFMELAKLLGWEERVKAVSDQLPPENQVLLGDL